jgi:hypothetical protein
MFGRLRNQAVYRQHKAQFSFCALCHRPYFRQWEREIGPQQPQFELSRTKVKSSGHQMRVKMALVVGGGQRAASGPGEV